MPQSRKVGVCWLGSIQKSRRPLGRGGDGCPGKAEATWVEFFIRVGGIFYTRGRHVRVTAAKRARPCDVTRQTMTHQSSIHW